MDGRRQCEADQDAGAEDAVVVAAGARLDTESLASRFLVAVLEAGSVELFELLNQPVKLVCILPGGGEASVEARAMSRAAHTVKRCLLIRSLL